MEYTDGSIKFKTINMLGGVIPTGMVMPFAGDNVPNGFLLCNGQAISRATYANLFSVIGTKYGTGDGSTTFNLPDLVGRFIEGGTESGEVKEAGIPNITGTFRGSEWWGYPNKVKQGILKKTAQAYWWPPTFDDTTANKDRITLYEIDASKENAVYGKSNTVQPASITMMYIIKI